VGAGKKLVKGWTSGGGHTRLRHPDFEYLVGAQCALEEATRLACCPIARPSGRVRRCSLKNFREAGSRPRFLSGYCRGGARSCSDDLQCCCKRENSGRSAITRSYLSLVKRQRQSLGISGSGVESAAAGGGVRGLRRTLSPPTPLMTLLRRAEGCPSNPYVFPEAGLPAGSW
jgi:hypothetical protein